MKKKQTIAAWVMIFCFIVGQILSGASAVMASETESKPESNRQIPELIFTNEEHNSPDLYVSKKVVSLMEGYEPNDPNETFIFSLSVDGKPYKDEYFDILDASGNTLRDGQTDSRGRFKLHADETAYFAWVGMDASYTVKEEALPENYVVNAPIGGEESGVIPRTGKRVTFTNGYIPPADEDQETTTVEVSKRIVWQDGYEVPELVKNAEFTFSVEIDEAAYDWKTYDIYDTTSGEKLGSGKTDGEGKLKLSANQKAVFAEVPMGVDYTVKEILGNDNSNLSWRVLGFDEQTGVTENRLTSVLFNNTCGVFEVTKEMDDQSRPDEKFTFYLRDVNQQALSIPGSYLLYNKSTGKIDIDEGEEPKPISSLTGGSFKMKAGQSALFFGVPANTIISVSEAQSESYKQVVPENTNGYQNEVLGNTMRTYPFVNEKREVPQSKSLMVSKRVVNAEGSVLAANPDDKFTFVVKKKGDEDGKTEPLKKKPYYLESRGERTLKATDQATGYFTLKAGEMAVFDDLDPAEYEVYELVVSENPDKDGKKETLMPVGYSLQEESSAGEGTSGDTAATGMGTGAETGTGTTGDTDSVNSASSSEEEALVNPDPRVADLTNSQKNTALMEFVNTYKTEAPKGKISIVKKDENGNALADVEFELKLQTSDQSKSYTATAKTDNNGEIAFTDLAQGNYVLTETKTVAGHTLLKDPIYISIPMTMTETEIAELKLQGITVRTEGEDILYDWRENRYYFYELTYEITNTPNFKMPAAGANGFYKIGIVGFGIFAAGIYYALRRRPKTK